MAASSGDGLSGRAARGVSTTLAGQAAKFSIQAASIVVLSRLIDPASFGLFVIVSTISALALMMGDSGLSFAAVQARSLSREQKTNLYWCNVLIGVVVAVFFFLTAPLIARFFQQPDLVVYIQAISVTFVLNGGAVQLRAEFNRKMQFGLLSSIEVGSQLLGLVVGISLAISGAEVWALVLQQIAIHAFSLIACTIWSRHPLAMPNRTGNIGSLLRYGRNTLASSFTNYVSSNADNIALGRYATTEAVGLYGRMFQLFSLPLQQLAAPLTRVALPILASIQDDSTRFNSYIARAQLCITYCCAYAFALLAIMSPVIVPIVLGPGWEEGVVVLQVLCLGGLFQGVGYVYYWVFLARAATAIQFKLGLISRAVSVAVVFFVAPMGMTWVALAFSFGLFLNWLVYTVWGLPRAGVERSVLLVGAWRPVVVTAPIAFAACTVGNKLSFAPNEFLETILLLGVMLFVTALILLTNKRVKLDIFLVAASAAQIVAQVRRRK